MDFVNVTFIVAFVDDEPTAGLALFSVINILATSVVPFPLGVVMCIVAGIIYGAVYGAFVYIVTSAFGAWITFLLVRLLRPLIIPQLGAHANAWERLDGAIMREGVIICMLWRVAPIAPFVISSALISMTSITQWQYVWTTSIGVIPSTIPIVSAAALGRTLLVEDHVDRMQAAVNVLSIGAGVYVMYRLVRIAQEVLSRDKFETSDALSGELAGRIEGLRIRYGSPHHKITML